MKEIASIILKPGMILAKDVLHKNRLLYPANTKVDAVLIDRLKRYSIMCVSVKDEEDFATTHYEKMRYNQNFLQYEKRFGELLLEFKAYMLMFIETGQKPQDSAYLKIYHELASLVPSGNALLDYLYQMVPNEDELTFTHALNSAMLAGCFADWLKFNDEKKNLLIMCAFFYDIGKFKLPYDILWKPGKLTDEEFRLVKTHPLVGYEMVKYIHLNDHIKNTVLMHHERVNGQGYPQGLRGNDIDVYAKIIAIVDTYIAMASPRSYRGALCAMQILADFEMHLDRYDTEYLLPLMKRIADAQIGAKVRLNDDTEWEILIIHPTKFSRPILKNAKGELLDLSQNTRLEITKRI